MANFRDIITSLEIDIEAEAKRRASEVHTPNYEPIERHLTDDFARWLWQSYLKETVS